MNTVHEKLVKTFGCVQGDTSPWSPPKPRPECKTPWERMLEAPDPFEDYEFVCEDHRKERGYVRSGAVENLHDVY